MNLGRHRRKVAQAGAWLLVGMSFAGCDDAAKRPVQAHAPALGPSSTSGAATSAATAHSGQAMAAQTGPVAVGNLPVRNLKAQPLISLTPRTPGGIPYLIER